MGHTQTRNPERKRRKGCSCVSFDPSVVRGGVCLSGVLCHGKVHLKVQNKFQTKQLNGAANGKVFSHAPSAENDLNDSERRARILEFAITLLPKKTAFFLQEMPLKILGQGFDRANWHMKPKIKRLQPACFAIQHLANQILSYQTQKAVLIENTFPHGLSVNFIK
ncbi:hypothetical protein CEXT_222031 [Caerostris extrusa]|uniref:Uncharacterized protein n=1 Tax=Caerostris extrusa TaxID=172846 RepID=A0AAV4VWG8_CAEEX|nr:hypothetical protein CEXT_222031 [Caerostris extrusa]